MSVQDSMRNDAAIINQLIEQIDRHLSNYHYEVGPESMGPYSAQEWAGRNATMLKHVRLVLGGPAEDTPMPKNVVPLRLASHV